MLRKPQKLQPGDTVAAVSLSWGGPATFPHRYEIGKRQLAETFQVTVVATRHALREADWLARNPQARADDLMQAFADPAINGIIATIGGDDSIRLLPYLDLNVIRDNPKVFLGYSDTTVTHFACYKAGIVSFYGPAIMAGFAENGGLHRYCADSVRRTLFSSAPPGKLAPNPDGWTVELLDWADPANQARRRALNPAEPWRFLQGADVARGHLLGGCIEVVDWLRDTPVWPERGCWNNAILFLETSEEAPPPAYVGRFLRGLAAQGILHRLAGLLFGRPGGQIPPEQFAQYDDAILEVVAVEQGLTGLPVVTRMDFGHTDPMLTLPYGVLAEIDGARRSVSVLESGVTNQEITR